MVSHKLTRDRRAMIKSLLGGLGFAVLIAIPLFGWQTSLILFLICGLVVPLLWLLPPRIGTRVGDGLGALLMIGLGIVWGFGSGGQFGRGIGIGLSVLAGVAVLLWLGSILTFWVGRRTLLAHMPEKLEFHPISSEDIPEDQQTWFAENTDMVSQLGFKSAFLIRSGDSATISRILIHPQHHCYAELSQVQMGNRVHPVIAVQSNFHTQGSLSHRKGRPILEIATFELLCADPEQILLYRPDIPFDQLFAEHLQMREILMRELHLTLLPDLGLAQFTEIANQELRRRRQWSESKSILAIALSSPSSLGFKPQWVYIGDRFREQGADDLIQYLERAGT